MKTLAVLAALILAATAVISEGAISDWTCSQKNEQTVKGWSVKVTCVHKTLVDSEKRPVSFVVDIPVSSVKLQADVNDIAAREIERREADETKKGSTFVDGPITPLKK